MAENKSVSTGRNTAPTETSKSESQNKPQEEEVIPQFYVWLANGEVLLANEEDLPGSSGHANPHGHWEKDGVVYEIAAIYPAGVKVS